MSSLIFHSRASTLCRATEASETCRCVASPTGGGAPAHTHTHTCTHVPCRHAPTLYIVYSNNMLCVLSSDCPATAAAPAAATQNQPPAAANPGEAVSCVCVCVCVHPCIDDMCVCMYVTLCIFHCVCKAPQRQFLMIVIVADFLCSAISIWRLNQRCCIKAPPPL